MSFVYRSQRWAALCGLAVLVATLTAPAPAQVRPPEENIPWAVQPDPWPFAANAVKGPKAGFEIGFKTEILLAETPSPYYAVLTSGLKVPTKVQFHDARTLEPVGQAITAEKIDRKSIKISPHGDQIAAPQSKADRPTILLFSNSDQKVVESITLGEGKSRLQGMDFAGKNRLLTVLDGKTWQVWDTTTGKEVSQFRFVYDYSPNWTTITPGGRYLIVQETNTLTGYHLNFWDLSSGKKVGRIATQKQGDGFGQTGGLTVSPDGKELAMTWRIDKGGVVAKIMRFDLVKGVKIGEYLLRAPEAAPSVHGLLEPRARALQFLPDGRGWLLSGHQIVDRETGAIVWKIEPAPKSSTTVRDRPFLGSYHLLDVDRKALSVIELPKAELDAAFSKARAPK